MESGPAPFLMALDEACLEAISGGRSPPTIRLYRWEPAAVSIGNFQCLADEVDVAACEAAGVPVVRRETGGGAVFHDQEVTYSILGPVALFPADITASHREVCGVIVDALRSLGLAAEFRAINDVVVEGKKISGSAQTRKAGVFLQHGTILVSVDPARMFSLLTPDKAKMSDKPFVKSVKASVTSAAEHGLSREDVERALLAAFRRAYPCVDGTWSAAERSRAAELAASKYSSPEWTGLR